MSTQPRIIEKSHADRGTVGILGDLRRDVNALKAKVSAIAPGSVGTAQIANGAVNTAEIAAGAITTTTLAAGAVTATNIAAHTITSTELSSTAINGMVITGSTIQTSLSSNYKVIIDNAGLRAYGNSPSTPTVDIDASTGIITATGFFNAQPGSTIPTSTITGSLPAGANRLSNSNFQDGAGNFTLFGWSLANATGASSIVSGSPAVPPVIGGQSLKLTATATGTVSLTTAVATNAGTNTIGDPTDPYKAVVPGLNYAVSWYVWPFTNARAARIDVAWYNSAGTLVSVTTGTPSPTITTAQWTRQQQTFTPPASAAFGVATFNLLSTAASDVFYVNCMQMEMGDQASAYMPRPDEILYNSISAAHISVATLAAISANLGTITAGTITGVTITGATIQTAASGSNPRAVLGPNPQGGGTQAMWVVDTSGNNAIGLDGTNGIRIRSHGAVVGAGHLYWYAPSSNFSGQLLGTAYSYDQGSSSGFTYIGAFSSGDLLGANSNALFTSKGSGGLGNSAGVSLTALGGYGATIYDSSGNSNFVQAGDPSSGTPTVKFRLWGPYYRQFTGWTGPGNNTFTVTGGFSISSGQYVVMASLENGSFMDHCTWCVTASGNGTMSFSIYLATADTASGWFKCFILTHGGTSTG